MYAIRSYYAVPCQSGRPVHFKNSGIPNRRTGEMLRFPAAIDRAYNRADELVLEVEAADLGTA